METFVLLPFFLLSRVPSDANTWRHGPEYTFMAEGKITTLTADPSFTVLAYEIYTSLICRPRDFDTLHCRFDAVNATKYEDGPRYLNRQYDFMQEPFDLKFDRQGVQSLVVHQQKESWQLNVIRAFVSQLNFGVELLNKPDDAFNATESSYLGQCESLVNVSRKENNRVLKQDYEVVPMTGFQKKQGEVMVIEKTKNLEDCVDKRMYMLSEIEDYREVIATRVLSSRSRIEISDTGFKSYTKNRVDIEIMFMNLSLKEKISLNLVSVLPAKEPLKMFSENITTIGPYVYGEKA